MLDQRERVVVDLPVFPEVWFLHGPPSPEVIDGSKLSIRYAVDGGHGWAVVQAQLHPRQREEADEFRAFPNALLETMSYRLAEAGLQLPDDLRAATIERSAPTRDFLSGGEACLVAVDDMHLLSWARRYQDYQSLVTIYKDRWLAAVLPHGYACALTAR